MRSHPPGRPDARHGKNREIRANRDGTAPPTLFSDRSGQSGDAPVGKAIPPPLPRRSPAGKKWNLEKQQECKEHSQTVTEKQQEELEADPMVASAMSLFEEGELIDVQNKI